MVKEMGKPINAAIGEVIKSANHCRFYARNMAKYLQPEIIGLESKKCYV